MTNQEYPCCHCGYLCENGSSSCVMCGRNPNEFITPACKSTMKLSLRDVLVAQPVMKYFGYPIGYLALKIFTWGKIDFGPWNNYGRPYDLSIERIFSLRKENECSSTLNTETVAVIGWNLAVLIFLVAVISLLA